MKIETDTDFLVHHRDYLALNIDRHSEDEIIPVTKNPYSRLDDLPDWAWAVLARRWSDVPLCSYRLVSLHIQYLGAIMANRPDCPIDRVDELDVPILSVVMAARPDCPLDRLGELHGRDLASVMRSRQDCPLDRLGDLSPIDQEYVLSGR